MKAIILAGGFGTRLRPVIGDDMPKCLAPVMGKPMIAGVIKRLKEQGISDITLALHHKAEMFVEKFGNMKYKIETIPLGTGGAIKNCIEGDEPFLVVNGDTITSIDYNDMIANYHDPLTIAVTPDGKSSGICIISPKIFESSPKGAFSFENDIVPHTSHNYYPIPWFTDLGTPEAYAKVARDWV